MAVLTTGSDTRSHVRFVLDHEVVELAAVDPTRTVLQFLREDLGRRGTKEGCAEGDCGACTVVLVDWVGEGKPLSVRAVNACIQFLPTLDGRELLTVESLRSDGGDLHPVQRALVDHHGSQCGFCTPGFVMSLFALYKTKNEPSRRDIDDALAGNLCRCTGYRPIIAAAKAMYARSSDSAAGPHEDWLRQPCGVEAPMTARGERLRQLSSDPTLRVQHAGQRLLAPRALGELAELLAEHPTSVLLAGGTDLGLAVTKRYEPLESLIYLGRVAGLADVRVSDTHIEAGAAATLSAVMPVILDHYPLLDELFRRFGSPPIRNQATLGGNIANGSPIGDTLPPLMAAGASLVIRSAAGSRECALDAFYHGYQTNDLRPGEFIERVRIPLPGPGVRLYTYKLSKRFDQDISAVCIACLLEVEDAQVKSVRVAAGGLAATVCRARHCEAALADQPWTRASVEQAMDALADDFAPISDLRASAAYRLRAAQNLLQRLYLESTGELVDSVYAYGRERPHG